jgi:multidrug transporter EmrE-like cation transporter
MGKTGNNGYSKRMNMARYLPLIVLGVLLNASAQLALKQGMRQIGYFDFGLQNCSRIFFAVALNPFILIGLGCYVVSVAVWLLVLSRVEVSYAYPLLSIGYIVTAFAGQMFFNEGIGATRWAGIIVICAGVWLITRSA